jgi:hypothetical protein
MNSIPDARPRATITLRPGASRRPSEFWFVQAVGRRPHRIRHASEADASAEALRLSSQPENVGLEFQVFRARLVSRFRDGVQP